MPQTINDALNVLLKITVIVAIAVFLFLYANGRSVGRYLYIANGELEYVMPAAAASARPPHRRLPRFLALAVAMFLFVAFVLPFAARQCIGPDRLKSLTEQALTDALGRRVSITGEVSIFVVPWFGLAMGPVRVDDAPGFGDKPMLEADRLEMTIRILPLLARVVSPGSVRIDGLTVRLRRDEWGRTNWEGLTAPSPTASPAAPGWEVAPEPRAIRLENAAVDYQDALSGRHLAVTGVQLKTGLGQPFGFSASFAAEGLVPDGRLECHVQGTAFFDADQGRLRLNKTVVEAGLALRGPLAPGGATPTNLASRLTVAYDPKTAILTFADLDVRGFGVRLTGGGTVTKLPGPAQLRADLTLTGKTDGPWRAVLGLTPGDTPGDLVTASPGSDDGAGPDRHGPIRHFACRWNK